MKIILGSRRDRYLVRVSIFLITVALVAGMVGCGGGGGNGDGYIPSPSQNLEIRTWYDLDAIRDNLSGNHTLMNNLDSTTPGYEELASPTANQGKGWDPIETVIPLYGVIGFVGTFDGQAYEIRDLFINRPDENDVGLLGNVEQQGVIKDIGMINVTVIGGDAAGGLVGFNSGNVSNCYATGNVSGNEGVGGLAGTNVGTVSNSYSSSNVTGNSSVGGLVGWNDETVSNSYFTGNVTGNLSVGGLVGLNWYGTVTDSYSTSSVIGNIIVGGLVGENEGTVSNCYAMGSVTGNSSIGGLVGENYDGTVSNSFWDIETSGQNTSDGGTGKTTAEMQDVATFSGAGWNITAVSSSDQHNPFYIWNIVDYETYPFLSWQPV